MLQNIIFLLGHASLVRWFGFNMQKARLVDCGESYDTLLNWFLVVMVTHRLTQHVFLAASWTFDLIALLRFRSSLLRPLVPEPLGSLLV